jgi:phytoene dehydrogenase-like protein
MHFRTGAAVTAATMSRATIEAVFASHRSVLDPTVAPAGNAQSAGAWAWLAAIESPWNSSDQNKTTDSTVAALDKVLARFGL